MFKLTKIEGGRINVYEPQIYTVGNEAVVSGEALILDGDGLLSQCPSTTKPTFIALAAAAAGANCPVGRVESNQIYEVEAPGALVVGTKYTINSDASGITASEGGAAEVVYADDNIALVRF